MCKHIIQKNYIQGISIDKLLRITDNCLTVGENKYVKTEKNNETLYEN